MQPIIDFFSQPYVHAALALLVAYVLPALLHKLLHPAPGTKLFAILARAKAFGFDPDAFERAAEAEAKALLDASGKPAVKP